MSWIRNLAETDPLLLRSSRDDFPESAERGVSTGACARDMPRVRIARDWFGSR